MHRGRTGNAEKKWLQHGHSEPAKNLSIWWDQDARILRRHRVALPAASERQIRAQNLRASPLAAGNGSMHGAVMPGNVSGFPCKEERIHLWRP